MKFDQLIIIIVTVVTFQHQFFLIKNDTHTAPKPCILGEVQNYGKLLYVK